MARSYLCTSGSTCTIRNWLSLYRRVRRTIWRTYQSTARSCQGRGSWSLTGPAGGRNWYPTAKTSNPGAPCREGKPRPRTLLAGREWLKQDRDQYFQHLQWHWLILYCCCWSFSCIEPDSSCCRTLSLRTLSLRTPSLRTLSLSDFTRQEMLVSASRGF